jgi:hypothetical protein
MDKFDRSRLGQVAYALRSGRRVAESRWDRLMKFIPDGDG